MTPVSYTHLDVYKRQCLYFGGNYNQNGNHGLFYVNYTSASNSNANIGCRVLLWTCLLYTSRCV